MTVVVNVTAEDISNGIPGDPESCPIALALEHSTPAFLHSSVEDPVTTAWLNGDEFYADLPAAARDFVHAFDNRKTVSPITFQLDFNVDE